MAATIGWLLEQTTLGSFQLLAGERGLSNSITSVNIMDNPDTIRWLTQGELILTTGYLFLENTWLRNNAITELSKKGCAGIGFILKRYMDCLPQEMKEQADSLGFPIISVPYERSMAEVGWLIYERIFEDRMSETERLANIYKRLTETVAMEHGVSQMLTDIVTPVRLPAIILDAECQVIEYEIPEEDPGGLRSLRLAAGQPLFSRHATLDIRNRVIRQKLVSTTQPLGGEENFKCVIFPVTDASDVLGYLCLCETTRELGAFDYHFVQTIQPVLSLYLMRRIMRAQMKVNTKNDFIRLIMSRDPVSQADLQTQCDLYQFDYRRFRVCTVIQLTDYEGRSLRLRREAADTAYLTASEYLDESHRLSYKLTFHNNLILFFMFPGQLDTTDMLEQSRTTTQHILGLLSDRKITCQAGLSKAYSGVDTIRMGLRQAFDAIKLGDLVHPGHQLYSYQDDQIYHVLAESLSRRRALELYEETLGKLRRFDQENHQELALTVQNFLKNRLSTTETAREMFIHRNTLSYRLEKVREVLGADPRGLETSLGLLVGSCLETLLEAGALSDPEEPSL